jgi:uncharacterized protein YraI
LDPLEFTLPVRPTGIIEMRQYLMMAAVAAAAAFAAPTAAMARLGFVTTNLNLRAGPSTSFPVVDTLPAGARVNIHGCLSGYSWCDVGWRGERGWVAGRYLDFVYRGRRVLLPEYAVEVGFPIVTFAVGSYWNHYYRHRHFYHRRHYFERRFRHHRRDFLRRDHREHFRHRGRSSVLVSPPQSNNFGGRHHGRHSGGHHVRPGFVTGQPHRGGGHVSRPSPGNAGVHMGGRRGGGGGGNPHIRGGGHSVGTPPMGGRGPAGGGGHGGGGGGGVVHDY